MLQRQGEAAGDDPVAACESAVRSIRAAFAQPGALERTVHHTVGDMPGRQLLVQLVANCVVHSWDLATAIGVDPGLDEQLIELSYEFCVPLMQNDAVYAYGWFRPPASPLPAGGHRAGAAPASPGPLTAFPLTAISERADWAVRAARAAVPSLLPSPRARSVS